MTDQTIQLANSIKEQPGCSKCDYVCDTPRGSFCTLTNEPVETTECYGTQADAEAEEHEQLLRGMR